MENRDLETQTVVREYNLSSKEEAKSLVKKNVPCKIRRKINGRNDMSEKNKDRVLHFLAVIIGFCRKNGTNKIRVTQKEIGEEYKARHEFIAYSCDVLTRLGLLSTKRCPGGTEYELKFDFDLEENANVENCIEEMASEPAEEPEKKEMRKMTTDDLIHVIEMQEDTILKAEAKNKALQERVDELEAKLNEMMANESSRKIEEAKKNSPKFLSAVSKYFFKA